MRTSTDYRRYAEECRRLARDARNEQHRKILRDMAETWDKLAEEAERTRAG
jgi:hypothetical protein